MLGFKAIIFDVDGTLADTERDGHRPAFNAAFAEAQLDWHWDVARYGELLTVTGGKERIRYFMDCDAIRLDGVANEMELIADLHRAKTRHYVNLLQTGAIPLRSGVARLLREARAAGIRLAIATTTTPENVAELLDHCGIAGLRDWFDVIAAGDVVPAKKPAPDIFTLALAELGLRAEDCVAVEDSDNGARAALGAGIKALVVTLNEYTAAQEFDAVPLVVDQLGEPGLVVQVQRGTLGGESCVNLAVLNQVHRAVYSVK
jgi:HAD superfamily hydrolase (TIGR01509 family)